MIVSLMGGVGNQLFQYAFGISVAKARGLDVGFTMHRCLNDRWRPAGYQLDMFVDDIKLVPATVEGPPFFTDHVGDAPFTFQKEVYTVEKPMFFGYWQTEKYFDTPLVREKVKFRYPLSEQSLRVAEEIDKAGKGSTFLHVRRGADYKRSDFHALSSLDYYAEVERRVREKREGAKFFVFGDDPVYIHEHFAGDYTIVDHIKPDTNAIHEDMHLMSLCQNGAIPNSSFSWWASWIGDTKPDRMIFATDKWFGDKYQKDIDTSDLIPERWTRL